MNKKLVLPSQETWLAVMRIVSLGLLSLLNPVSAGIRITGIDTDKPRSKSKQFLTVTAIVWKPTFNSQILLLIKKSNSSHILSIPVTKQIWSDKFHRLLPFYPLNTTNIKEEIKMTGITLNIFHLYFIRLLLILSPLLVMVITVTCDDKRSAL